MDSDHPLELNIRRGRRPGEERNRPTHAGRLTKRRDRVRHAIDQLMGEDDADVVIDQKRQGAASLASVAVQDDGARFRDR
jgi:hypothetical protein